MPALGSHYPAYVYWRRGGQCLPILLGTGLQVVPSLEAPDSLGLYPRHGLAWNPESILVTPDIFEHLQPVKPTGCIYCGKLLAEGLTFIVVPRWWWDEKKALKGMRCFFGFHLWGKPWVDHRGFNPELVRACQRFGVRVRF